MSSKEEPVKKRQRINFQDVVHVRVGKPARVFTAYKAVLTRSSTFFASALRPEWSDTKKVQSVALPEDDAEIVEIFLQWAISGEIVHELDEDKFKLKDSKILLVLVKLYVFGDKIGSRGLKNGVMDHITRLTSVWNVLPDRTSITLAFDSTLDGSKLRAWIIDNWVHRANKTLNTIDGYPDVMIKTVLCRMMELRGLRKVFDGLPREKKSQCYYHEHDDATPPCQSDTDLWLALQSKQYEAQTRHPGHGAS